MKYPIKPITAVQCLCKGGFNAECPLSSPQEIDAEIAKASDRTMLLSLHEAEVNESRRKDSSY